MQSKPVRTYLDPDAVGPLPRAVVADDSDAMASARTMVRLPDAPTQELRSDDVLEVVDPNCRPSSLAPIDYDTGIAMLPRKHLAKYVVGAMAGAAVIGVIALVKGVTASAAPAPATASPTPPPVPTIVVVAPPAAPQPSSEVTVGTLRIDGSVEGHKVYVDGVALTAPVAMLRCGKHDLSVGSPGHPRSIDVPCGGEVTVFR
jgi:hypothetical protein